MGRPMMCTMGVAKKGALAMEEIIGVNVMAQLD
jgi:hypothetical protein